VRKVSFARYLKTLEKVPATKVWTFYGADRSLINTALEFAQLAIGDIPARRVSGKLSALSLLHTMGDLDFLADKWTLIIDGFAKVSHLDQLKPEFKDAHTDNYVFILETNELDPTVLEWLASVGKVVNCQSIDDKDAFAQLVLQIFAINHLAMKQNAFFSLRELLGQSVGSFQNAALLLRFYYGATEANPKTLSKSDIEGVVPVLNYEDVFAVVESILYRNLPQALNYYTEMASKAGTQLLFLDRLLALIRDMWVFAKCQRHFNEEQKSDLSVGTRVYARLAKLRYMPSVRSLERIYVMVLQVYCNLKSNVDQDHMIKVMMANIIKMLDGQQPVNPMNRIAGVF